MAQNPSFIINNVLEDLEEAGLGAKARIEAVKRRDEPLDWAGPAIAAGWSRDVDDDADPCFMNMNGTHEYSYVKDWETLCRQEGIAPAPFPVAAPRTHVVSNLFAEYLMDRGENIAHLEADYNLWTRTEAHEDLLTHPLLLDAEQALDFSTPSSGP